MLLESDISYNQFEFSIVMISNIINKKYIKNKTTFNQESNYVHTFFILSNMLTNKLNQYSS